MSAIFRRDRVTIMAVLNSTPDSFSDGGRFLRGADRLDESRAVDAAAALVSGGAHVLDVGGESTLAGKAVSLRPLHPNRSDAFLFLPRR